MAKAKMVRAKEPIVINVGGKPVVWHGQEVVNKRTGHKEYVDFTEIEPKEPAIQGTPYAFKSGEKVRADHPAVKANPGAFAPDDDEE